MNSRAMKMDILFVGELFATRSFGRLKQARRFMLAKFGSWITKRNLLASEQIVYQQQMAVSASRGSGLS